MPKPHTFPTLFDDLKTVSISFLNKHGYLKVGQWQQGSINWSRNGSKTGSISIMVDTIAKEKYLELNYACNGSDIRYRIQLITVPSNLGKGLIWYFICPNTGKRCKKLYLNQCYFYHRSAFKNCMYEKQTQSKKSRDLEKALGAYFLLDAFFDELYKKNFKKVYRGKPTKRYLYLVRKIEESERIPANEIERMILS